MKYDDILNNYKNLMSPIEGWNFIRVVTELSRDESDKYFANYSGFRFSKDYDAIRSQIESGLTGSDLENKSFMDELDTEIVRMKANEVKAVVRKEVQAIASIIEKRINELNVRKEQINASGLIISAASELGAIDEEIDNLKKFQNVIDADRDMYFLQSAPYASYKFDFMNIPGANKQRLDRYFGDGQLSGRAFFTNIDQKEYECNIQLSVCENEINELYELLKEPKTNILIGNDVERNQSIVDDLEEQIAELKSKIADINFELGFYGLARKMNIDSNHNSRENDVFEARHSANNSFDDSAKDLAKIEEVILASVLKNSSKFDLADINKYYNLNSMKNNKDFSAAMAFELEAVKKKLIYAASDMNLVPPTLIDVYERALDVNNIKKAQLDAATTFRNNNLPNHGRIVTVTFDGPGIPGVNNPLKIEVGNYIELNFNPMDPNDIPNLKGYKYPEKEGYDFVGWTYDEMGTLNKPFTFVKQRGKVDPSKLSPEKRNRRNELLLKSQSGFLTREEEIELDGLTYRDIYVSPMINYNITLKANFMNKTMQNVNNKCLVSFDTNGGSRDDFEYNSISVDKGSLLSESLPILPDPILDDEHEFTGWTVDGEPFDISKPIEKDIKLVATYKEKKISSSKDDKVRVTFVDKDGEKIRDVEIDKGTAVPIDDIPSAPVIEDMDFRGWVNEAGSIVFSDQTFDKDTTLKAAYVPSKFVTIKFVGDNGEVYREERIERGSKYQKLTPEYDKDHKRIKGYKKDKDGNWKKKKTSRLYGWLDANNEQVDFDEQVFEKSTTLKSKCKFNWERAASVAVGAISTALALHTPLMLAAGSLGGLGVVAATAPVALGSFVLKNLVDRGVISKRQPLTSIKSPSDRIKNFFTKAYNKVIASAEMWDDVMHATLTGSLVGGIDHAYDKLSKKDEPIIDEPVDDNTPVVAQTDISENVEVFDGVDYEYVRRTVGGDKLNVLKQWWEDNGQKLRFFDENTGKELFVGKTPITDITGPIKVIEIQDGIATPMYKAGEEVVMGYFDKEQAISKVIEQVVENNGIVR